MSLNAHSSFSLVFQGLRTFDTNPVIDMKEYETLRNNNFHHCDMQSIEPSRNPSSVGDCEEDRDISQTV